MALDSCHPARPTLEQVPDPAHVVVRHRVASPAGAARGEDRQIAVLVTVHPAGITVDLLIR
jgi:hypothetical protein